MNPYGSRLREQSWGHGTQKPVECMRRPIVNNSRPGQAIYDPFLGSGTSPGGPRNIRPPVNPSTSAAQS